MRRMSIEQSVAGVEGRATHKPEAEPLFVPLTPSRLQLHTVHM